MGRARGVKEKLESWAFCLTIYMEQIEINGAGGSVTVVANPWVRRFPHVSAVRPWPAIDGTVRGPLSMAPCVARERFCALLLRFT